MRKIFTAILTGTLVLSLAACSGSSSSDTGASKEPSSSNEQASSNGASENAGSEEAVTIRIGASPTPHAEILNFAKDILSEKYNINLEIVEYSDYVIPNTAVEEGDDFANYFQHTPYLDNFNENNGTHLVSVAKIHYEPFGLYSEDYKDVSELPDGATIAVPNDGSNEARALYLLEAEGLIKLNHDAGYDATVLDIVDNPKNLKIQEVAAEMVAKTLDDVDGAIVNGNYALEAGLKIEDAIATESADSDSAQTYANIVVVKEGNENDASVKALVEVLTSEEVKEYINNTYNGAVVPIF